MSPRERYLAAVNRQDADRPPLDLMGTACGLTDGVFHKLKALMSVTSVDRIFRFGENVKLYNEDLLEALHIDARRVWMRPLPESRPDPGAEESLDEWGISYKRSGAHFQRTGTPLKEATIEDLESYPYWPDMKDPGRVEGLRDEAKRLHDKGKYAVIGRSPTAGFFERGCWMRSMEQYLMDMVTNPEFIEALNEKIVDLQIELYGLYLDACGEFLDVVETADDYGSNLGTIISPDGFRKQLKSWRAKLNKFIKSKAPHIKIFHHTCGNVRVLIPDFIEIGIDILNPVQPVPGMEAIELAKEFGKDMCFHGGLDTITAMRGTEEDVKKEFDNMRTSFRGAAWIVAPANHFQDDVPAENIRTLYEYAGAVF